MDWRLYHWANGIASHHHWLEQVFRYIESYGTVILAVATFLLWLLARPGADRKWKLASSSALAAGALGLLVNQIVHAIWDRPRPYESHHVFIYHPYAGSKDAAFPSDHASAAFGIAFAVFLFDRLVGSIFLAAAVLIGAGRVIVGAHYPLDVVAGLLIGAGCAVVVVKLGRPVMSFLVRLVERVTDPVVRPVWRSVSATRR